MAIKRLTFCPPDYIIEKLYTQVYTNEQKGGVEMAVPKRKTSKARRDKRRSQNMKMTAPGLSICPQCHEPKLPHRVCPNCNYYNGKEVVSSEA